MFRKLCFRTVKEFSFKQYPDIPVGKKFISQLHYILIGWVRGQDLQLSILSPKENKNLNMSLGFDEKGRKQTLCHYVILCVVDFSGREHYRIYSYHKNNNN